MKRFFFTLIIIAVSITVYSQLSYKPSFELANNNEQFSINSKHDSKLLGIDGVTTKTRPRQGGLQKYSLVRILISKFRFLSTAISLKLSVI